MRNKSARGLRPLYSVKLMTAYVSRWPFRHIYGAAWLKSYLDQVLGQDGSRSILKVYGLEFRDSSSPPKIHDLVLVTVMQCLILLSVIAAAWWAWEATNDYVLPGFIVFSIFHVVPSDQDFLTSGRMADRVPAWISPITNALSFVVSLPAMIIAIPMSIIWGALGWLKLELSKTGVR
jgi:hypothetical protein